MGPFAILITVQALFFLTTNVAGRVPAEQQLYKDLMQGYEKAVRPVVNSSHTVHVSLKLQIIQIVDLDERQQVLTTKVSIDQYWVDEHLNWDPDEYNGVRKIRVSAQEIWLPDTFIYNNADQTSGFMNGTFVQVDSSGRVFWPVPMQLKSSCMVNNNKESNKGSENYFQVEVNYFPFDDQLCVIQFGSWIYSAKVISFDIPEDSSGTDLSTYEDDSEFILKSVKVKHSQSSGNGGRPEVHPDLVYILHIQRRFFYYIFNIVIPCVMLSSLTLFTFWLPAASGEKVALGLSVFVAFSMFMLRIAENVPATSHSVPLISVYLTTVMTMTSVSVILGVLMINLFQRGVKVRTAPKWVKTLALTYLAKLLRMEGDIRDFRRKNLMRLIQLCKLRSHNPGRVMSIKTPSRRSSMRSSGNSFKTTSCNSLHTIPNSDAHACSTSQSEEQHIGGSGAQKTLDRRYSKKDAQSPNSDSEEDESGEAVWILRSELEEYEKKLEEKRVRRQMRKQRRLRQQQQPNQRSSMYLKPSSALSDINDNTGSVEEPPSEEHIVENIISSSEMRFMYKKAFGRLMRKEIVVEWQCISIVLDRFMFWVYLVATIATYIVIFVVVVYTKPNLQEKISQIHEYPSSRYRDFMDG
ncbi:neuronal acetylcholine receptor subunit alpha-10 isoform X1 [Lingula anatina]|uniref:Neuronal acetylcholine receptor subunit alpha-10 isoform X1 n=1 Tax=Lingula anatina TaxID=7574 RepID=A0A2R2MKB1_LINAN|nr:neuronal acetylcholine receptor subunit alpha-10 isoform X1 [Lingula anatina]XP_023930644.1 neuronal acetylcholine receptor subunit alpha-10 isoform X1 [Lingula anatina]|eukprot:XP_023930643.1 neuronal acetylcholine receptor subunit alpha-10 isoform X1 [Lingula anatina]